MTTSMATSEARKHRMSVEPHQNRETGGSLFLFFSRKDKGLERWRRSWLEWAEEFEDGPSKAEGANDLKDRLPRGKVQFTSLELGCLGTGWAMIGRVQGQQRTFVGTLQSTGSVCPIAAAVAGAGAGRRCGCDGGLGRKFRSAGPVWTRTRRRS